MSPPGNRALKRVAVAAGIAAAAALVTGATGVMIYVLMFGLDTNKTQRVSGGGTQTVTVELTDFDVTPGTLVVDDGTHLILDIVNKGDQGHDLAVDRGIKTRRLRSGESQQIDIGVRWRGVGMSCTVSLHEFLGMKLAIRVVDPPRKARRSSAMDDVITTLTVITAVASGLVAGFFFAFSFTVMWALGRIPAPHGIGAMQSINIVVINPLVMLALFGTALLCLALTVLAVIDWESPESIYLIAGSVLYLVGVVLVTMAFNVPRNEALAAADANSPAGADLWQALSTGVDGRQPRAHRRSAGGSSAADDLAHVLGCAQPRRPKHPQRAVLETLSEHLPHSRDVPPAQLAERRLHLRYRLARDEAVKVDLFALLYRQRQMAQHRARLQFPLTPDPLRRLPAAESIERFQLRIVKRLRFRDPFRLPHELLLPLRLHVIGDFSEEHLSEILELAFSGSADAQELVSRNGILASPSAAVTRR